MTKLYQLPAVEPPRPKLKAVLKRFCPTRSYAIYGHLYPYYLLTQVDTFVGQSGLLQAPGGEDWQQAIHHLCRLAGRLNWFPVDWQVMDDIWQLGMELGEEDQFRVLSHFLFNLPLKLFGWTPEEGYENEIARSLRGLLREEEEGCAGCPPGWGVEERLKAWARLEDIEHDPARYPASVHLLPAICRWTCHLSGNFILDTFLDPFDYHPVYTSYSDGAGAAEWYTWRPDDLKKVHTAWQEAEPVIENYNRLNAWCDYDDRNAAKLLYFIRTGHGLSELNW